MCALSDYWTSLIRSLTISISFINCKSSRHKLIFFIIYSKPYSMVIKGQTKIPIKGTCLMCIACSPLSYRCLFHFIVHHRTAGSLFATHKGIIFPPSKGKRKNISFELLHPSLLLPHFPFFFLLLLHDFPFLQPSSTHFGNEFNCPVVSNCFSSSSSFISW